jgi:hypothetical protein
MSEPTPEAAPTATEPQQATQPGQEPVVPTSPPAEQDVSSLPQWARDAISKANGEAAKYRTQVRDLEPKAQQFAKLEEASKTELQRQTEALEAANRAREEAQAEALRFRVAAEEGVSKDDLDLLGNGDEEQIRARAVRIAEMRTAAAVAATAATLKPGQRPQEALRPGATPSNEPLSEDEQLYQAIYGPQK